MHGVVGVGGGAVVTGGRPGNYTDVVALLLLILCST